MVKVKNAYGDIDILKHYGTTLIRRDGDRLIVTPFYSASSVRAINQWLACFGYAGVKLSRKQGNYEFTYNRGLYNVERIAGNYVVTKLV